MLAGARQFKAGDFAGALIEFRVAQKLGAPDGGWYAGAALQKLQRPEDAIEAFAAAEAAAPGAHDALLDWYRAMACYDARLYTCADRLLASVGDRGGPRIADQVRATRDAIARVLSLAPSTEAIDWYHRRAAEAQGRPALVAAYLMEAAALGKLRSDQYRVREAESALARVRR